jgi:hypothetical protein
MPRSPTTYISGSAVVRLEEKCSQVGYWYENCWVAKLLLPDGRAVKAVAFCFGDVPKELKEEIAKINMEGKSIDLEKICLDSSP